MEKITKDEHYWVEEFRKGNEKALAYFFRQHYRSLCYFVSKMIQNDEEAEDIAAISFIKLWDRKDDFDTKKNVKAFLFITCRNASLNFLKHLERRNLRQEEYVKHLSDIDEFVLNQVVESEFLNALNQEIEQLPEQCRKVFSMIYFEGKKTEEIAYIMDISVKTVRNHKSRAIELLHNSFLKKKVSDALMLAMFIFLNKK